MREDDRALAGVMIAAEAATGSLIAGLARAAVIVDAAALASIFKQ